MFIVNVKIAGAEGLCALFYNAESKAEAARDGCFSALNPHEPIWLTDDHGHQLVFRPRDVMFVNMVDMKKDLAHQADMQLTQLRENQKLQQRVNTVAGLGGGTAGLNFRQ